MQVINLRAVATDNGVPESFSTTVDVRLTVRQPENFFSPELDQASYTVAINEDLVNNSIVLDFTVTDFDVGPSSEIGQATILGSDSEFFTVTVTGTNSGQIRTRYVEEI